jgi:hypothetical protein
MPNGRPGDHPVYDIVHHGMTVFGSEIDGRVRAISRIANDNFQLLLSAIVTSWPHEGNQVAQPAMLAYVLDTLFDCISAERDKGG